MKKIYTLIVMMSVALVTLTSCNKDAEEANTLNGQWSGYVSTYYYDRWGLTGEDYRTTISFEQTDLYGGTGFEVDFDLNNPYGSYYYSPITWHVQNGVIRIYYTYDNYYVDIYKYVLNSNHFSGYMDDGTNRDIQFSLTYDGSTDWSRYRHGSNWRRRAQASDVTEETGDSTDIIVNGESVAAGAFARAMRK